MGIEIRKVEVPFAKDAPEGYAPRRIQISITQSQANALRSVKYGLMWSDHIASTRRMESVNDAIRWLIDEIVGASAVSREKSADSVHMSCDSGRADERTIRTPRRPVLVTGPGVRRPGRPRRRP